MTPEQRAITTQPTTQTPHQTNPTTLNNTMTQNAPTAQTMTQTAGHTLNHSDNLFVANLQSVSLEKLVKTKLEVLFDQQKDSPVELNGLHSIVIQQVEKPLIELALQQHNGNQVKTAKFLGINRNTLKKKMDAYRIRLRNFN